MLSRLREVQQVFSFGALLIDELPGARTLGGAPFNFAYYSHLLGTPVTMVSGVGDDAEGKFALGELKRFGMQTKWIRVDPLHPTGYVKVTFNENKVPSYLVRENTAYDFIVNVPPVPPKSVIYIGTSDSRGLVSLGTVRKWMKAAPDPIVFCDINLRPPYYSKAVVEEVISLSHVMKLSQDEANEVMGLLGISAASDSQFAKAMFARSDIELLLLTKGPKGAAYYTRALESESVPAPAVGQLKDTVGSGDVFCARFLTSMMHGEPIGQCLRHAVHVASRLCEHSGAIVSPEVFRELLS